MILEETKLIRFLQEGGCMWTEAADRSVHDLWRGRAGRACVDRLLADEGGDRALQQEARPCRGDDRASLSIGGLIAAASAGDC